MPFELPNFVLVKTVALAEKLIVTLRAVAPSASCPRCRRASTRVRGCYLRVVRALPADTLQMDLHLRLRRFRCMQATCPQQTFTEQYPTLVARRARRSVSLKVALQQIGLDVGG